MLPQRVEALSVRLMGGAAPTPQGGRAGYRVDSIVPSGLFYVLTLGAGDDPVPAPQRTSTPFQKAIRSVISFAASLGVG